MLNKTNAVKTGETKKEQVMEALANWILQITSDRITATPEEVAVLPEVAEVLLDYFSSSPFSAKNL